MTASTPPDTVAEWLRLALPMMARNGVPVTPPNYAVWYAYISGEHQALRAEIQALLDAGQKVDAERTAELHRRYLAPWTDERIEAARSTLGGLAQGLAGSMEEAGNEVSRYQRSLAESCERLKDPLAARQMRALIDRLAAETAAMRSSGERLRERLEESRREVEALRRELDQARHEAHTDALTGLLNRKGLDSALAEIGDDGEHCLLMIDIDRFKRVNDRFGHLVGDRVIQFVASTIRQCVKGRDTVSRFGGEEFAVLLPYTPFSGARSVAETVRSTIAAGTLVRSSTKEPIGQITVSVGVARRHPGETPSALIARADAALYRAKELGRNRVEPEEAEPATGRTLATGQAVMVIPQRGEGRASP